MLSIPLVRILTFSFLLRSALCRPGQCLSGQNNCKETQVADTQEASTQTIEALSYRGYQVLCPGRSRAVQLLLQQIFSGIAVLYFDLAPDYIDPTSSASPARDAFLQSVSPNFIKPFLQKISTGAKTKGLRIPATIDEDAELRPSLSKIPGRPHIVCATPEAARLYDHHGADFYEYCTKPENGQPLIYSEFGNTVFLCPRFFEELRIWQGGSYYCPEVSPDGTSFLPQEIRGKPAQEWFDGWQHLVLFRELVKIYLGDRALTSRTTPPITEDWNKCYELEGDAARNNPRNWVLWMAAVEQQCTEFPSPGTPEMTEAERLQARINTTDLLSTYYNDSYVSEDIFPNSSYLTPTRGSSRSGGSSRSASNRGSPSRGSPSSWSPNRGSPASLRLDLSPGDDTPSPDDVVGRISSALSSPLPMRDLYRLYQDDQDRPLQTIEEE